MNRGVYTAATGMMAQQRRLEIVSNNLANVNTRGYKADRVTFGEAMRRAMNADDGEGEDVGSLSAGADVRKEDVDFSQGGSEVTGNALDVTIKGTGMFGVQTAKGVEYTRDGAFSVTATNGLVTQDGNAVLDTQGKPIVLKGGSVRIEANGDVFSTDGTPEKIATIGRFGGTFTKDGHNLYQAADAKELGKDAPDLASGQLETANIEPVSQMVEMIALQRGYETAQKMVQSQDEATGKLNDTISS